MLVGLASSTCGEACQSCRKYGPYICDNCVGNAIRGQTGQCSCTSSWSGMRCEIYLGICHPICWGCNGPEALDCVECGFNSHRDIYGACVCNQDYMADDCSIYDGQCDGRCIACTGPDVLQCLSCMPNADKNEYGLCECKQYYYGEHCETYDFNGACAARCKTCTGPLSTDCTECVSHASKNGKDECVCDDYWEGDDCGMYTYTGLCHPTCDEECFGPHATDCAKCVPHAYYDSDGICVCQFNWAGDDCSIKAYQGHCDPICDQFLDCTGPSASDCEACGPNSEFDNAMHACACIEPWIHEDCSFNSVEDCYPICLRCSGPRKVDCLECVPNAHKDELGYCQCDFMYSGQTCSYFSGVCHPICETGCNGPSPCDCFDCVDHATMVNDTCVCDQDWELADCGFFVGECHAKCTDCHGPNDCDCDYCVEHAYFDSTMTCVCLHTYDGEDCSNYIGDCHPICETCHGPSASECLTCVENSDWHDHVCTCSKNWDGLDCSVWVGPCDIRCDGCKGPDPCDCTECIDHASFDSDGLCVCDHLYTGYACEYYVGYCDEKCVGCFGQSALECEKCTRNAFRNSLGECECLPEWRNQDCSVYAGQCDPRCQYGCFGPLFSDCMECVENASMNEITRVCECDVDWHGSDCSLYNGLCMPTCLGCSGPDDENCETCVAHAHRDSNGVCICDTNWNSVADCSEYNGPCFKNCSDLGCRGPTEFDCVSCVANAVRDTKLGICECDEDWGDSDDGRACSRYTGHCDAKCAYGCTGPTRSDCIECVPNSVHNISECRCITDFGGADCSLYTGTCASECTRCFGPYNYHCTQCVENAQRDGTGACKCKPEWTGLHCETIVGCDPICEAVDDVTCFGTGPEHCAACKTNAHRDWDGKCVCDEGWTGEICDQYTSVCDPKCDYSCNGPTAYDCYGCITNAYISPSSEGNLCVCLNSWTGEDCQTYKGWCDPHCLGCTGPTAKDCVDCVANAYYDGQGGCICKDTWHGEDCSIQQENCKQPCLMCRADTPNQCTQCAPGYTMVNGFCVPCHESCETCKEANGTTENDCLSCKPRNGFELGTNICVPCHPSCLSCNIGMGPGIGECTSCFPNSTLMVNPDSDAGFYCVCDFPKVRLQSSFTCENTCSSGNAYDPYTRYCSPDETGGAVVHLELNQPLPIYNSAPTAVQYNTEDTTATSCFPPTAFSPTEIHGETTYRGSYFDGIRDFIELKHFDVSNTFLIELWARPYSGDVSLTYVELYLFMGWETTNFDGCDGTDLINHWQSYFDFWLAPCYSLVADLGDTHRLVSNGAANEDEWSNMAVQVNSIGLDTTISILLNGVTIGQGDFTNNVFKSQGLRSYIGSYTDWVYSFHGFMYSWTYYQSQQASNIYQGIHNCPSGALSPLSTCLALCSNNEYLDHELECEPCHASCNNGCSNGGVCYECHATCRTCTGPSVNDCVDCWCYAERDMPDQTASCCNCASEYRGAPEMCFGQVGEECMGCKFCAPGGKCYYCDDGWEWNDDWTCSRCNDAHCQWEDIYEVCGYKGPRRNHNDCGEPSTSTT